MDASDQADLLQSDGDWDEVWAFFTSYTSATVNSPRDLSACTASGALQRVGSSDAPFILTTGNGLLAIAANTVILHVPTANMTKAALAFDNYVFDLVVIDNTGKRAGGIFQKYRNVKGAAP